MAQASLEVGLQVTDSERGYSTSVLSRTIPESKNKLKSVEYLQADTSDRKSLSQAFKDKNFSHVVNLGGDINHSQFRNGGKR